MNFDDAAGYDRLKSELDKIAKELGIGGNRLFYLATTPGTSPRSLRIWEPKGSQSRSGASFAQSLRSHSGMTSNPPKH